MKMDREIHWQFESMGEPTKTTAGFGAPKQMFTELIRWMAEITMHRRMIITVAKTAEELIDRRSQIKQTQITQLDQRMDDIFAQVMAEPGVE